MALHALKTELNNYVQAMLEEGVLDSQFIQIRALQDSSDPNFVAEVLTCFCNDAERVIPELHQHLNHDNVDFGKLESYVDRLKGSSSSIGAQRMKVACTHLGQAYDDKNKGGCLRALSTIASEYYFLRSKLEPLIELEKRIFAIESNQQ